MTAQATEESRRLLKQVANRICSDEWWSFSEHFMTWFQGAFQERAENLGIALGRLRAKALLVSMQGEIDEEIADLVQCIKSKPEQPGLQQQLDVLVPDINRKRERSQMSQTNFDFFNNLRTDLQDILQLAEGKIPDRLASAAAPAPGTSTNYTQQVGQNSSRYPRYSTTHSQIYKPLF